MLLRRAPRIKFLLSQALLLLLAAAALCGGCALPGAPDRTVLVPRGAGWSGVVVRQLEDAGSRLTVMDVDLRTPGIQLEIASEDARRGDATVSGQARTVADWVANAAALGGINGGFFGRDLGEGRKQLVGVFVRDGRALTAAPSLRSERSGTWYTRSSFGLTAAGAPSICWAAAPAAGAPPRRYPHPEVEPSHSQPWNVREAVGCGPRLIHGGERLVTDRLERLVSEGARPRTFVGFSREAGAPRYFVLATAAAMSFESCARFLKEYFRRFHGTTCAEAMALDGGASTQMAYRAGDQLVETTPAAVTVPTAILVRQTQSAGR